ncbi:hypothetical protein J4E83_005968 [Alternaria metachromatica]|uniref:uncharacterized protein n=1 Tax=Alternaria metachromatica TaxID=283354 RepID=UPI0020C5A052|nr:uncharacterized protein J4E83_005968 [Alternaria metachromatica]KAI4619016.1 hypothetical protein J4E83_005968 [Alternaria metachromatica]
MDDVDTILKILRSEDGELDLPPDLVVNAVSSMSENIYTHWGQLNEILVRHEDTIRARWKKKSQAKRRELLCVVQPDIPHLHRPDCEEPPHYCADCACKEADKPIPGSDLWPYINLEDLSDAKSLLVFVNARGRNCPGTFAPSEPNFSALGIRHTTGDRYAHVKILIGDQREGDEEIEEEWAYGRVVGFECEPQLKSQDDEEEQIEYEIGLGLQILRIQEGILRFLVGCCENIMHEITPDSLCSDLFPIKPMPPSLSGQEEMISSFADASRKAPYTARAAPDFARIRYLVSTVLENAKDHAWALREDPAYFAEYVQAYADHRHENVLNDKGQPCSMLGSRKFYSSILREILVKAYAGLIFWDQIHQELVKLEALHECVVNGPATSELIERYWDAVGIVYYMLRTRKDSAKRHLRNICLGAPQLRHLRVSVPKPGRPDYTVQTKETDDEIGRRTQVLLTSLSVEYDEADKLHFLLDFLETHCQREPSARQKLSPMIEVTLNELSISVECLHQLRISSCYDFLGNMFSHLDKKPLLPGMLEDFCKGLEAWRGTMSSCCEGIIAPNLGDPTDGKFNYPSEDAHSKQTVDARRKAERNLDRFWRYVDNSFRKLTGCSQHDTIRRLFEEGGPMRRTAQWHDPEDLGTTSIPVVYEYIPVFESFHDSTQEITGNFNRLALASKSKSKTHGAMALVISDVDQHPKDQPTLVSKPLYHVGKDAYAVLKALFYMPNDNETPGKIRWDQVVATLTKLGFAVEKLHGSAWQFTPKKLDLPRGIQFHEPHPGGEVPLTLARQYGRRLARAYGWEGKMFKQK